MKQPCIECGNDYAEGYCPHAWRRRHVPTIDEWRAGHHQSVAESVGTGRAPLWVRVAESGLLCVLRVMGIVGRVVGKVKR